MAVTGPDTPTIGIDVGGSQIKAGVVGVDGAILDRLEVPTPQSSAETYRALDEVIRRLRAGTTIDRIGVAIAGFVDADRTSVRYAPHLAWRDEPVAEDLSRLVGCHVVIDHDVNCAAWAEYRLGAAVGARTPLVIALGTGIGAGLIHDGALYRGAFGTAPELGHLTVVPDGRPCACGKRGCLERYCSGTALVTTAAEIAAVSRAPLPTDTMGGCDGAVITAAARAGDPVATAALAELATWLGRGLAIAADVLDPDVIVIAGGVAAAADLYLDAALDEFHTHVTGAGYRPEPAIRVARFGPSAALIGAALLACAAKN